MRNCFPYLINESIVWVGKEQEEKIDESTSDSFRFHVAGQSNNFYRFMMITSNLVFAFGQ